MQITFYRVHLKTVINDESRINNEQWYPVLANIYNNPGPNFDGYVSNVEGSSDLGCLSIHCYTVEGPEEKERLSKLKEINTDWALYRKSTVINKIICYASQLGYKIKGYTVEQY
jgi:hypothetical protein